MSDQEYISLGEQVDLYLGKGQPYRTKIEDITDDGMIVVSVPTHRGIPIIVRREQRILLYFYRENGRYEVDVEVAELFVTENIRMISLVVCSSARKHQQREAFRLKKMLDCVLRDMTGGEFPVRPEPDDRIYETAATIEDISETGAGLRVRKPYEKGEMMYLRIYLRWPEQGTPPEDFLCEVMQVTRVYTGEGLYNYHRLGVKFEDVPMEQRTRLARYVVSEQQKIIKQTRLVQGE